MDDSARLSLAPVTNDSGNQNQCQKDSGADETLWLQKRSARVSTLNWSPSGWAVRLASDSHGQVRNSLSLSGDSSERDRHFPLIQNIHGLQGA